MPRLSHLAVRAASGLACVAVGGLMLLAVATTVDIAMRYLFASPIRGFVDIASLSGAVLLAACFPYVLVERGNIAVDALGGALGPRFKRWLDGFAVLVSAAFFALMAWQYLRFAWGLKTDGELVPVLRWPVWPWWMAVAVVVVIAAVLGTLALWARPEGEA